MLDVTAFSNALLAGSVSYSRSLGVNALADYSGHVQVYVGEDAAVYPLGRGPEPMYALRVPLNADGARSWPERYADRQSVPGGIHRFLPSELTILDSDAADEPELALLYRWIAGDSLTDVLRNGAPGVTLDTIVHHLADLATELRGAGLVHGDIAPGNIIVQPDGTIRLIDLDRMGSIQHGGITPRRRPGYRLSDTAASPEAEDAFGLLVLMASVAASSGMGELPMGFESERGTHPPLLFSSWDLMDPSRSELVRRLEADLSGTPALLLKYLIGACTSPSSQAPQILADAVRDVRRAPQGRSTPSAAAPQSDTWDEVGEENEYETWAVPDHRDTSSWPSSSFEEPDRSWDLAVPKPPHAEDVLARIDELASLEPVAETGRNRHRSRTEARRQRVAYELREALASNDRAVLVRLAMSGDIAELGDSDRSELVMVLRALSYDQIARAIASDQDSSIIAAIDPQIFPSDADVDDTFRARVQLSRERNAWMAQLLEAIQQDNRGRCAKLLAGAPDGAWDRLPAGVRERAKRLADIAVLESDIHRALTQGNLNGVVGPMARLSALAGRWTTYVDADEVVSAIGYSRIRQRVIDRLLSGGLTGEDQWLIDCVTAAGDMDDVARAAGKSRDEMRFLLASGRDRQREVTMRSGQTRSNG